MRKTQSYRHKSFVIKLLIVANFIFFMPLISNANEYETMAKQAFYSIEENAFNTNIVAQAARDIEIAFMNSPQSSWVLIAVSRLIQESGYTKGDRYYMSTYIPGTIEKSEYYAKEAVNNNPNLGMAYSQLAKIQIIQGKLKEAWLTLNNAYDLDSTDFYPWYYRAIISVLWKDHGKATSYLDTAELYASQHYQKSWVVSRRISLAKLIGDKQQIDKAYKRSIEQFPENAYFYGNYASYLKQNKRYKEAVDYYRKAIGITPYPLAKKGLDEALFHLNK